MILKDFQLQSLFRKKVVSFMSNLTDMTLLCQSEDGVAYMTKLCLSPSQVVVVYESASYGGLLWLSSNQVAVVHDSAYWKNHPVLITGYFL